MKNCKRLIMIKHLSRHDKFGFVLLASTIFLVLKISKDQQQARNLNKFVYLTKL